MYAGLGVIKDVRFGKIELRVTPQLLLFTVLLLDVFEKLVVIIRERQLC